ncbi:hypothetical protein ACF1BP_31550 [Streptomyces sp. NPDC014735]|uniref:hypothetical protein n=1 Tax=unclassified Streptomyces TaxID=2593676 RepID=UPI00093B8722|nr:hypothetical protein [Streptomyces sp. CB01580]OKJ34957.1 hypothetical protein AMK22_16960 [Streptomyces sp. CB01580]
MRIELTWPRPDTDDRTLTLVLPDLPDLPARLCAAPVTLLRAVVCAEPLLSAAVGAVGAGPLTRAALPYALRFARQALDTGTTDRRPRHD